MPCGKKRTNHEMGYDGQSAKRQKNFQSLSATSERDNNSEDTFSEGRCIAWFRKYISPYEPDTLGPEGMECFCKDIGVDPENIVMLVLAYKMGAKQMGYLTLSEWLKGLTELQCDSPAKLQSKIGYFQNALNDEEVFKSIYQYTYDFVKDMDQRTIDISIAKSLLQLLLGKRWLLYKAFREFLSQSEYKVINRDQWYNILEFSLTIWYDLSNYDIDEAWPVMLDEFVEWLRQQRTFFRNAFQS